jgi:dihydrofolate reductase
MGKLIVVVHVSLDGFVAGPNGDLDGFEAGEENLEFVCQLTETADTALFGRVSYELLNGYWPTARNLPAATPGEIAYSNWYNNTRKVVISRTLQAPDDNTVIIRDNTQQEILVLKKQTERDILLFGSPTVAQELRKLDLIDGYWIFINPVLFGRGLPLFADVTVHTKLKLLETKRFANGELALKYQADRG